MSFAWSQAAIDLLFRFYVQEGKSAADTARLIGDGITRDAVLGKAQRKGWTRQLPSGSKADAAPARPRLVGAPAKRLGPFGRDIPLPPLREIHVPSTPKPWTERRAYECAFPVGEPETPGAQLSCCALTGGMSAYCPAHRALMRLPDSVMTQKEQDAVVEIARRAA